MKLVSFAAALLTSVSAFAYSTNYTNLSDRSNYVEAVSASNQDGEIALRVSVQNVGSTVVPTVIVAEQAGGFQCKVIRLLLIDSAYNPATRTFTQSFEARVIWAPGAQNSGCLVRFQHASLNNTSAIIYMENNQPTPSPIEEDRY